MTNPHERTNSVIQTRILLLELANGGWEGEASVRLRRHADRLLDHFPGVVDLCIVNKALPDFFAPPIELGGKKSSTPSSKPATVQTADGPNSSHQTKPAS
jgi:hypothetical protein